jgi:hypothetical protein
VLLVLVACEPAAARRAQSPAPPPVLPPPAPVVPAPAVAPVVPAVACAPPPVATAAFRHKGSSFTVALGRPFHGANDAIVAPGAPARIAARFTYGIMSKDLVDERVVVAIAAEPLEEGRCPEWRALGTVLTGEGGLVSVPVDALEEAGRYLFALTVEGDASVASGAIWVIEPGRRAVVFDIDGTLTEGDEAIFQQLLSGMSPPAKSGAAVVAAEYRDHEYLPVYLTGRPHYLGELTRAWLTERGFPTGPLQLSGGLAEATGAGVQRFKTAALTAMQSGAGMVLRRAYGNAETDICSYAAAGIPAIDTFIVGPFAGHACAGGAPTQPLASYDDHLATLSL